MLWTWVFPSKNNFYFVHIRRAGCSFLSWRDKEEMRTMGFLYGMSYYSYGLVLWILIFFFPRLSILFPMDLILHSFMLMLLQWSCLWYQRNSSMFTTSLILRQSALEGGNLLKTVHAKCLNSLFEWDKVSWETWVGAESILSCTLCSRKETAVWRKCERNGLYICIPLYRGLTGNTWGLIQEKVNRIPL